LIGVEKLITAIAKRYVQDGIPSELCHVLLPLSPNHGGFGGDGLYAETKAGLEVLLQKWTSERGAWAKAVTFCAAWIGWVRGTGLMDDNNPVAAKLEQQTGVRTFASDEMGFLLSACCSKAARKVARMQPLYADFTGRFGSIPDLKQVVDEIREQIESKVNSSKTLAQLKQQQAALLGTVSDTSNVHALPDVQVPKALKQNHSRFSTATQKSTEVSLDKMVVIVGLGEISPLGSARTRFEIEVDDQLSASAVQELAWMTGLIHFQESAQGGAWVDTETEEELPEYAIADRYRKVVRERVGLRFVEPETAGFDPLNTTVFTSVFLERDFTFAVSRREEAASFVALAPEQTRMRYDRDKDTWWVTRVAGSEVRVPRQVKLKRTVAGMVPQGFSFERYGIPQDMIDRVDRVTLFNLVATIDAFMSAGLSPEELMQWIHPARVANTQGSGIGGMRSIHRLYVDPVLDRERQSDILQETLINVVAAHIVQSYVGSYGAMSHPVAACATAAVSLEEGLDKILAGKADFVVTGGFDDLSKEGFIGFADMNATAETSVMEEMGLRPEQMSRPNDIRRRGFVEAQGGGTMLLTSAETAIRMGLPVYGVLAYVGSFSDGIHKSIPAPGMGVLACAMGGTDSPLAKALDAHGLSADDIALVYKHDTSTNANDPNENALHHRIQSAIGRTPGNPLFVVSQKSLTGHSKGGAAAWQVNGLCQSMRAGILPGNPNLDCVDEAMRGYTHLVFSNRSLDAGSVPLEAGLATSLGFGHVGCLALVLHPRHFVKAIPEDAFEAYEEAQHRRRQRQQRLWNAIHIGDQMAYERRSSRRFRAADGTFCQGEEEARLLLDHQSRLDPETGTFASSATQRDVK
ncbi:MAG: beta-ketoacyl synthase N-terminal-like domain-containing protein, partial [Myxococcota bacterium]